MLPPGRNRVPGRMKHGGEPDSAGGPMFATCALAQPNLIRAGEQERARNEMPPRKCF